MEIELWTVIGISILITITLLIKIHMLQKAAKEIENAFTDKLQTDTNTLIDISTGDRYMRHLANSINIQLRKLRTERHRFQQGDTELKNAITNISHDLRTPLTSICGYLDLLEEEEKSEAACRYIEIVKNRTQILTQLSEELFRYSVIMNDCNDAVIEPITVNSLLEESIAAFYTSLNERGITPDIKISEEKVIRILDRSALIRIFSNLLNNAIKYSDGDLNITLLQTGEIIFSNTASKLDEIQVGKLFDRFYTVETAGKSTGLGLAISRTLIEQMNGSISAKYKDNKLSICLKLPM
ncbi:MAG: HAMP domain-containing histidine kinase [Lachnospiraceae bacterium]|nr:HAMP domain-containing histidine kinase [Lachnospiraceae bacterium]MDE6253442.1 HAMP domain-containing histidine kinase [Lachnospiraceae bacterium]